MTIILTNDDGIDAPGIKALSAAVKSPCLWVAPRDHLSGCGHQVTTATPINISRRSPTHYAIAGTPADCVRLAISHLCPDLSWVLSGINAGGNLGVDTYISGTVAAVREAAIHGIPAIAISQYRKGGKPADWKRATRLTQAVLENLLNQPCLPRSFWNVNLPYLQPEEADPEMVFCSPSCDPLPTKYQVNGEQYQYIGDYGQRDRTPGTDVDVCFSGKIAISQIFL